VQHNGSFDVSRCPERSPTLSIGLIAIGLLLLAEVAGVVWMRGLSLREYLASFVTAPVIISLLMFSGVRGNADSLHAVDVAAAYT
jgi:hypothetical protein